MEDRNVTLPEMLDFRERKAMEQERLRAVSEGVIVISLGMNIPGPVKRTDSVFHLFEDGRVQLERVIAQAGGVIVEKVVLDEHAGCAAMYAVSGVTAYELKKRAVHLEETHSCGRLFDIDVLNLDGHAVEREQVGSEKRKCLLCGRDAKVCGRSRTHRDAF